MNQINENSILLKVFKYILPPVNHQIYIDYEFKGLRYFILLNQKDFETKLEALDKLYEKGIKDYFNLYYDISGCYEKKLFLSFKKSVDIEKLYTLLKLKGIV